MINDSLPPKKVIAVNTRLLLKDRLEGIGIYTHEILKRLCANHPEIQFNFLFDRTFDQSFIYGSNCKGFIIPPPTRRPILWDFWLAVSVPLFLKFHPANLFLSLDGFALQKNVIPQIIAIHDLNFRHRPEDLPSWAVKYYNKRFPRFADAASKIITVSNFSKRDIIDSYGVDKQKIIVAPNALPSQNINLYNEAKARERLLKMTHSEAYFIFVGAIHQRKNLVRLIQAFHQLQQKWKKPLHLIIAGGVQGHYRKEWMSSLHELSIQNLHLTGRITEDEKKVWIRESKALVYPSLYEGFGIPILEAWKQETAVICSDSSAMPEIAGDAALLIDPQSIESIAQAMESILSSEKIRDKLIQSGSQRLINYSWDRSADLVWSSIQEELKID